jgi:N utilization substance protein A
MAVKSTQDGVDPIGSCVGQRGIRIANVMNELGEEKIDIIEWDEDPEEFVAKALSPAKIEEVTIEDETATVTVEDDQLSLAIGRDGQNVRLAWKLTGYKIDIVGSGGEVVKKEDLEEIKEELENKEEAKEEIDEVEEKEATKEEQVEATEDKEEAKEEEAEATEEKEEAEEEKVEEVKEEKEEEEKPEEDESDKADEKEE